MPTPPTAIRRMPLPLRHEGTGHGDYRRDRVLTRTGAGARNIPITAVLAIVLLSACPDTRARGAASATEPLRIAVASNFRSTLEAIGQRYRKRTGTGVAISSGASGVLAAQIERGAPFDLFLAADQRRAQAVVEAGRAAGPPVCYARGRLVLLGADDLTSALGDPGLSIAIANPRSAPYGRAALAVLQRDGFAGAEQRRVLRGSNVQQALQFFDSGAADLALVARSLTGQRGIAVPGTWHTPIDQYAVVIAGNDGSARARDFLTALGADGAKRILRRRGYETCP